jgi:AAHS family 3-hydroxyphenylpropionic acid transporter
LTPSAAAPTQLAAASTIAMCFAAALIEGIDLQSMGIAASGISAEYHFSRSALGAILTASPCGLLVGAFSLAVDSRTFADARAR